MKTHSDLSDEQLFLRYANGDGAAFETLVDRYSVRLLHYCRCFTSSEEEAEDIVQDAFLRAIKAAKTYQPTSRFSSWLFVIARNLCIDRRNKLRRTKRIFARQREEIDAIPLELPSEIPASQQREVSMRIIHEAMTLLTPLEAETIWLTFYADWSATQIARLQGCSKGTVRARRHQAIGKMRLFMKKRGYMSTTKAGEHANHA